MPDGMLLHLRDTYPVETAWAPPYVGDELRQVRDAAWDARLTSLRAAADARAAQLRGDHRAGHPGTGADPQLSRPGAGLPAARDRVRRRHGRPDRMGRRDPAATAPGCGCRRRAAPPSPRPVLAPLRSAEPAPATSAQRAELTMTAGEQNHRDGPVDQGPRRGAPDLRRPARNRQSQTIPSEDPDYGDLGPAFPAWSGPRRGATLRPPEPEITPSPQILRRAMDCDADWEATD